MLTTIEARRLIPAAGGVVIVGYSGGADSTALLHLMTRVQKDLQIQVHAAHLHHGMRPEADADVEVCQAMCQQLGVPLHRERVDVPALARQQKLSLEEAGRNARYAFFERLAHQLNAVAVALAHTRDDQIETILINLLRGTGPRGLCGMPYKRDRIIRPLLDATRKQTHRYCVEQNLPTVFDSTNLDPHQLRRRVRAELIPLLRDLSPTFDQHLLRLAEILSQEEEWWEKQAEDALYALLFSSDSTSPPSLLAYGKGEQDSCEADASSSPFTEKEKTRGRWQTREGERLLRVSFVTLHTALQRHVLREWLRPHLGTLNLPPFEILEAIRNATHNAERTSWQLSPTLRLTTDETALTLHRDAPEPVNYEYPLSLDTPIFIPEAGVWIEIRSTDIPVHAELVHTGKDASSTVAYLDADTIQGQLTVRNARKGERFQPLGMPAPKKVSDIFTDRKVPKTERWRMPLLCDAAGVLWIPGYTIAERAKITPHTKRVLRVSLYRNADEE